MDEQRKIKGKFDSERVSPFSRRSEEPEHKKEERPDRGDKKREGGRADKKPRPRKDGPRADMYTSPKPRFSKDVSKASSDETKGGKAEAPAWLKTLRSLHSDKGRQKESRFIVEGATCVEEVVRHSSAMVQSVKVMEGFDDNDLLAFCESKGFEAEPFSRSDFEYICGTQTTQGILAICYMSVLKPNYDSARLVTLVDAVQDPGNLGGIFRTSLGFGMDSIIMGKGTVDAFNSKVVRGSSGTFLRLPFESRVDLAERISFLRSKGFTIIATSPHAKNTLATAKLRKKVAFLVGNEGSGADSRYMDMADQIVKIPMANELESLNVAVAHGIVAAQLFEMRSK
ncbi:MAG: RNA methyltransferase [Fibrobacterales bacterium]